MKETIRLALWKIIDGLVQLFPKGGDGKKVAIIRLDELGDYVLFRNALLALQQTLEISGNHRLTLIGNAAWKNLYDSAGSSALSEVFWVDKRRFSKRPRYRFQTLLQIRSQGFDVIADPHFTRQPELDLAIVRASGAPQKVGFRVNDATDSLFTELIPANLPSSTFEYFRNLDFVQKAFGVPAENILSFRSLSPSGPPPPGIPQTPFLALFPGSGKADKKWPPESFAEIVRRCQQHFGLKTVLLGSPADRTDAEALMRFDLEGMENQTGKTTLTESLHFIKAATAVLSVDTGSVHLAAALGTPVVALYSGKHYGRFAPYPPEITPDFITLYSPEVQQMIAAGDPRLQEETAMPNERIRDISVEVVWEALKCVLERKFALL